MIRLTKILLLALTAIFVQTAFAQPSNYRYLKPSSYDQDLRLLVSGKSRHYFTLDEASEVEITLKGPSKLKVMSRMALNSKKDEPEYSIEYTVDDSRKTKLISHRSKAATKTEYADGMKGEISVLRKHVIEIPRGRHTYRFRIPEGSENMLFLRFSQKTNEFTGGTPVVAMTPVEFTSSVDLVSREQNYTYYRVSGNDRVVLRLIGPATLKVLNRIEYSSRMQGTQKWKVQILEDGSEKKIYNLAASKSEVNVYREENELVPSRAETFYVEIPKGEHVYEFKLPENHRTAIFRFLLPKSQLDRD